MGNKNRTGLHCPIETANGHRLPVFISRQQPIVMLRDSVRSRGERRENEKNGSDNDEGRRKAPGEASHCIRSCLIFSPPGATGIGPVVGVWVLLVKKEVFSIRIRHAASLSRIWVP